jgi:hypothetical protein
MERRKRTVNKIFVGIDMGIKDVVYLEFMVRFRCGCWRRIGKDSDVVLNTGHCPRHRETEQHMDGL